MRIVVNNYLYNPCHAGVRVLHYLAKLLMNPKRDLPIAVRFAERIKSFPWKC